MSHKVGGLNYLKQELDSISEFQLVLGKFTSTENKKIYPLDLFNEIITIQNQINEMDDFELITWLVII